MRSVELLVPRGDAELVSDVLWQHGALGIEERDEGAGSVRLIAAVARDDVAALVANLSDRPHLVTTIEDPGWRHAWRPFARTVHLGGGLAIAPPWIDAELQLGERLLSLDPGDAWGHGAHPSTVLAAGLLIDQVRVDGARVLDVGCGSGALTLVAAALGAAFIRAIDVDPAAVEATLANATVNGVDVPLDVGTTPVGVVTGIFDVVVANIGRMELVSMAPVLRSLAAPGAEIVLSGLLDDQLPSTVAAFEPFVELATRHADGWAAVVLGDGTA
ncbi:MAG: 50S ribosomal protein L11 methyltransferase [Microthrixaceae bacterium]